jgi:uncharacterized membrane protein
MPIAKPIIWKTQLTLALLIAIPVALSAVRLMWFANGADPMAETMDTSHFANIPIPIIVHIAFGSLFCLTAIVQLTPEWRMASRSLHKTLGYIAAISGILAAVSAMIMVVIYPTGPFATTTLNVVRFGFAAFMGLCILNAVRNARARRIAYHRAWMIRAFAVAVAASTQAVFMGICFATIGDPSPVLATGLLTLGFAINAIFAEWWIIRARRPAPSFT